MLPDRDEMLRIIALHDADALMDYVTVGAGSYIVFQKIVPSLLFAEDLGVDLAAALKVSGLKACVIAEAGIRTPENANTVLSAGQAGLVAIVRGQIADPHLVAKARDGRSTEIRGCLYCNQQC